MHFRPGYSWRYKENSSIFFLSYIYWGELQHLRNPNALVAVSKGMWAVKLYQQNPPVLYWRCWLTQANLYNSRKIVVVISARPTCTTCYQQRHVGGCRKVPTIAVIVVPAPYTLVSWVSLRYKSLATPWKVQIRDLYLTSVEVAYCQYCQHQIHGQRPRALRGSVNTNKHRKHYKTARSLATQQIISQATNKNLTTFWSSTSKYPSLSTRHYCSLDGINVISCW